MHIMGFQKLLPLLLLVAQCAYGFYPMDYLDILRLSGLDSDEYYSKDETSRHDEATKEDYLPAETRHHDDYSNSQSDYHRDYDSGEEYETKTSSSLFEKDPPQDNDALYSPTKMDKYHKREEYFGELSKKSISTFPRPRKVSMHSPEDLLPVASDPNYSQPRSRPVGRSRRARLSDYDSYYPKRRFPSDSNPEYISKSLPSLKSYDDYGSDDTRHRYPTTSGPDYRPKSLSSSKPYHEYSTDEPKHQYSGDSNPEYKSKSLSSSKPYQKYSTDEPKHQYSGDSNLEYKSKSLPSSKPYHKYSTDEPKRQYSGDSNPEYKYKSLPSSKPYHTYSSDYFPQHVDNSERTLTNPVYSAEAYTRAPYHEPHSKPLSKPARKTYPRSSVHAKSNVKDIPASSTYNRQKSKGTAGSVVSRPLKLEREFSKKYPPRKFSESQARAPYIDDDSDEDFRGKPLVTTSLWNKEKRQPKHFSEENKHYLAATGYGKPVREQFHEQGTTGPQAYKFGYNTGDPENPMARYEERGEDGLVKGSYSYVDPMGKLQVVHYESHPEHGFKTVYA